MGSTDLTRDAVLRFSRKFSSEKVRLVQMNSFHGRGISVAKGVTYARGGRILVLDANSCVPFEDLVRLEVDMESVKDSADQGVVIGSHAHLFVSNSDIASTSEFSNGTPTTYFTVRLLMMSAFRVLFQVLCVPDLYDTQCPFKLFSRSAAQRIFSNLHLQSLGFECEILYLATKMHIPVMERAVGYNPNYIEIVPPIMSCAQLLRDLIVMRLAYMLGIWRVNV
jgi:dolichyl-phosphate beta-glucosyltransferase